MRKKLIALIMCLFSVTAVFSGCDLISLNTAKVLAATVAEVVVDGQTLVITKEQLLTGYSNYGAGLVQNNNYTVENAVKSTIDLLINRELVLYNAKKVITFTQAQEQKIWKDTYQNLNDNLADFESAIKAEEDIVYPSNPSTTEETVTIYTPFVSEVELVLEEGNYVLRKIETQEEELTVEENFVSGTAGFVQITSNEALGVKAMKRYIKQLKANEKEKNLSTVDAEVWTREVERIYKNISENLYLSEFEALYKEQFNISLDMLIEKYVALTREDYLNYANASSLSSYYSAAKSTLNTVYYHPANEFFKVTHLLVKYSTEQQAIVDKAKSDFEQGYITNADYQAIVTNMTNSIRATEKGTDGKATGNTPLAVEVLSTLQTALSGRTYAEQTQIFNNFIYSYNEDPGIMNAEKPYVVGLTQSDMVEAFTNSSRALNTQNVKGAISELVATEYGVHIIMYLGKVENLVSISDISAFNRNSIDVNNVFNHKLYDLTNKTMLDQIYDLVKTTSSSSYQNSLVALYRNNAEIKKYEFRYSNLWTE